MSGIGDLLSAVTTAVSNGNVASSISAVSNLQSALGTGQSTVLQAQTYISGLQVAQAKQDPMGWELNVQGLLGMVSKLPASDVPLVEELSGLYGNSAQASDVIARIQQSLLNHNFI